MCRGDEMDNMLEYLKELMESKYEYNLDQMKICQPPEVKNKFIMPGLIAFGVIVLVYILMLSGVIPQFLNIFLVIVAFVLLVGLPFKLGPAQSKYAAMILTPKYLIQVVNKREFVVVEFDNITRYNLTTRGDIIISEKGKKIVLNQVCYEGKLEPLMDILEAKGKTFDKSKDYMIRPIEISIVNDEVIIKDIEVESTTDKVFERFYKDYKSLTPGFIKDVIFRNAVVNEVELDDEELVLKLDCFEVNPGHPENTKFESIIAEDCIVIFESIKVKSVTKVDTHKKENNTEKLPADVDSFIDEIEKGIIAEWTARGKTFHVKFAAGVLIYDVSFSYKEVILGWNKAK